MSTPPAIPTVLPFARRLTDTVVELIPPKRIDAAAVMAMGQDAATLGTAPGWLMDATRSDDFDADCVATIHQVLVNARDHGGLQGLVMIVPDLVVRGFVQSSMEQAPVRLMVVDSRSEGLKQVGIFI